MKPYSKLLLDDIGKAEVVPAEGVTPRWPPSPETVPVDITPIVPLIDDFFHEHVVQRHERYSEISGKDFPPVAIPYREMWFDWVGLAKDVKTHYGMHTMSGTCEGVLDSLGNADPVLAGKLRRVFAGGKWVVQMVLYGTDERHEGRQMIVPMIGFAVLKEDGRVDRMFFDDGVRITDDPMRLLESSRTFTGLFMGVLFAMALMSCKNVEREDVEPPPALSKKRVKHGAQPLVRYHRLKIRVPGTKRYFEPQIRRPRGEEPQVGLHYVRGHFKTYRPEKPLLGRATGTFYWPPVMRGSMRRGVIAKTYVETPGDKSALP